MESRGLGDVYKRQEKLSINKKPLWFEPQGFEADSKRGA
jgi:hypothetical protein